MVKMPAAYGPRSPTASQVAVSSGTSASGIAAGSTSGVGSP